MCRLLCVHLALHEVTNEQSLMAFRHFPRAENGIQARVTAEARGLKWKVFHP